MKVEKPWGHEIRWAISDKYLGKILHINAGHRLSKQYHREKDETIYVLKGSLLLEMGPHHEYTDTETGLRQELFYWVSSVQYFAESVLCFHYFEGSARGPFDSVAEVQKTRALVVVHRF